MKVLSIRQPFASLIASGAKIFESRTWSTEHRGLLLIHASSAKVSADRLEHIEHDRPFFEAVTRAGWTTDGAIKELPRSAIIAAVQLISINDGQELDEAEELSDTDRSLCGTIDDGTKLWRLEQPISFEPLPSDGKLRLWELESQFVPAIEARIAAARSGGWTAPVPGSAGRHLRLVTFRPSSDLEAVIGSEPRTRREVMIELLTYLSDHELSRKRGDDLQITLDENLAFVAPGKKTIPWMRMAETVLADHLTAVEH